MATSSYSPMLPRVVRYGQLRTIPRQVIALWGNHPLWSTSNQSPPAPTIYETTCCSHFTVRSSIEILSRKKKKKYIFGRSPFPHTAYRFSFPFDFTTWSHTKRLFDVVWTLSSAVSCQTKKKNLRLRWALGVTRSSFRECHVVEQITCQFWGFFFFPFR